MAGADYQHCAVCDRKTFYDASIDWEYQYPGVVVSICDDCAKEWKIRLVSVSGLSPREVEPFKFGRELEEA